MISPADPSQLPPQSPPLAGEASAREAETAVPPRRTMLLPDIDWVTIPGGEFVYQEGERRRLPAFRIARHPVTNSQYQTFIDAGGYGDERWWTDLRRPEPEPSRWPQANRPRTNVDWYEAVAFCRWLSEMFAYEVRLPTEEEWERAARGVDGREYPWGRGYESGRANIDETSGKRGAWYLKQTTAVGVYPHGASSEGLLDLSGNVWEWCRNKYGSPEEVEADSSGNWRVLRGGSWNFADDIARCSLRFRLNPGSRLDFYGFRLVSP